MHRVLLACALLLAPSAAQAAVQTTLDTGERLRVVVWGDRAAAPAACAARADLRSRVAAALAAAGLAADVVDATRAGDDLAAHAARMERDVLAAAPHVVVMAFAQQGTDDGNALLEFLKEMVFRLHEDEIHVVFLAPAGDPGDLAIATAGMTYFGAASWFGEPYAAAVVAGEGPPPGQGMAAGIGEAVAMLHGNRNLRSRPQPQPVFPDAPPRTLKAAAAARATAEAEALHPLPDGTLLAGFVPDRGDFRLAADLVLKEFAHTAASLRFDGGHLGLDGASSTLFLEGPAFGGGPFFRANPIVAGKPFRLVVERAGELLQFRIDGELVAATRWDRPIRLLGFRPHRGELDVRGAWLWGESLRPAALPAEPGYSVPLIDLAADSARQVVVDREPGQYLGHPTTFLAEDGQTMHVVYPKGHGRGPIVYKRSLDGGRTWSERLPVPESWATSEEVPTLYRTVDAEGTRRLILFSGLSPLRLAVSEDEGETWSELAPISEDWGGIVTMASCVPAGPAGRYLAWFHDDGRFMPERLRPDDGAPFHVYQVESLDGGLTWGSLQVVASHPFAHLCEPGAVRSPDGRTLALLLRENSRTFNSFVVFSEDEGATWSEPRQLPAALTGDRHTAKYAPDGRLVITFRDTTRESPTQGDWVAWVGRWQDVVDGTEGQYRVRLMDNKHRWDCAYPGLELLPDGTFVTTTYGHWSEGEEPWIASVRFTLDELDALLPRAPDRRDGQNQ